jgi:hypothetical protein
MNIDIEALKYMLIIGGVFLTLDGIASFIVFRRQPEFNQTVRVIRAGFGIGLVIMGIIL